MTEPNKASSSKTGFHTFNGTGSFEVFYYDPRAMLDERLGTHEGWCWHACFPGCLPDADASGPFNTSEEAYNDAMAEALL